MSKKKLYIQCELGLPNNSTEVAWIQEHLAVEGITIKLKDYGEDIIKVNKVYGLSKKTLEEIDINRNNPLREATDI